MDVEWKQERGSYFRLKYSWRRRGYGRPARSGLRPGFCAKAGIAKILLPRLKMGRALVMMGAGEAKGSWRQR